VELSHQLDGTLRVYCGDALLLALPLPLQEHTDRRPAPITLAQKRKKTAPRIYNLGGRYLNDKGDGVSLQLVGHFLVATTAMYITWRLSPDMP